VISKEQSLLQQGFQSLSVCVSVFLWLSEFVITKLSENKKRFNLLCNILDASGFIPSKERETEKQKCRFSPPPSIGTASCTQHKRDLHRIFSIFPGKSRNRNGLSRIYFYGVRFLLSICRVAASPCYPLNLIFDLALKPSWKRALATCQ
jgi:hypothetical protein